MRRSSQEIAMKNITCWLIALAALSGDALLAQDLTGTWQGTLTLPNNGRELRTVIKVAKTDGAAMRGTMHSIDQGPGAIPINPITLQGSAVKMAMPGIGGTFEGKLEADGNTITGTWSQGGPNPLPLVLKRATAETAWAIPEPPPPPKPMAADAKAEFEVATIKPSVPDRPGRAFRVQGRQFSTINTTLIDIITFTYGVHAKQVTGGPSWMESEKFDIAAQPAGEGQPNERQWKAMVQKLLAERFKLAFRRDKKELAVYAVTVGKNGHKLTKSEADPNGLPALFFRGLGNLPARNANMADLARLLQGAVLDRPVIDQTDITGRYDFTLIWTPDEFQFAAFGPRPPQPPAKGDAPPDLFTAMQEQLGLKLESTKAPAEVFVVEKVEKPSEN
jgi:bla regulator protein blaR1